MHPSKFPLAGVRRAPHVSCGGTVRFPAALPVAGSMGALLKGAFHETEADQESVAEKTGLCCRIDLQSVD